MSSPLPLKWPAGFDPGDPSAELLRPGDILAVRGNSFLSRGILRATGNTVSHVGMLLSASPPIVTEALARVKTRPLSVSIEGVDGAWILTDKSIDDPQRYALVKAAARFSAYGYNYADIFLQLLDVLFRTVWFTAHALGLNRAPICSYLVANAYQSIGLFFGKPDRSVTPADIFEFAMANPSIYEVRKIA